MYSHCSPRIFKVGFMRSKTPRLVNINHRWTFVGFIFPLTWTNRSHSSLTLYLEKQNDYLEDAFPLRFQPQCDDPTYPLFIR